MPQVGSSQPVQYIPGVSQVPQSLPSANTTQAPVSTQTQGGYPYGDDVFQGQYQQFKGLYQNFDTAISKYSPFYGKMGSAQSNTSFDPNAQMTQNTGNMPSGDLPPIPQSALPGAGQGGMTPQQTSGDLPPIPQSALPGAGQGQQNNVQVPSTLPSANQNAAQNLIPKKNPPSGPVMNNLQQQLQAEAQQIQTPQKAIESIAGHAMLARQERTMANDIAWGAKYYANQAADMATKLNQNKRSMNPAQIQSQVRNIESLKIKSISLLNDAKKRAINNYNEALKATMLYNNFFTEKGPYASAMNANDRQFVESEIDKTWSTWSGGFDKEWNGSTVKADDSANVIDKAAADVAASIDKADKAAAAAQGK